MQFTSRGKKSTKLAGAVLASFLLLTVLWQVLSSPKQEISNQTNLLDSVYLSTTTVPVRVGGVVEAADQAIIYAQTSGVVKDILVTEGSVVEQSDLLLVQDLPVEEARLALASSEANLSQLQQATAVAEAQAAQQQASVRAYTASDLATIRLAGNEHGLDKATTNLEAELNTSLVDMVEAIDFIHKNTPLFSADGMSIYDDVVKDLYGVSRNYFSRITRNEYTEPADLIKQLEELRSLPNEEAVPTLVLLTGEVITVLDKLAAIYTTAEADVYDRPTYVTADQKAEYESNRQAVLAVTSQLNTTAAAVNSTLDDILTTTATDQEAVTITAIDEELAIKLAYYAQEIQSQTNVVSTNNAAVAAAQLSLGQPAAPFSGVVSKVYAENGEYVTAGTPLLELIGDDARQIKVTIPTAFANSLKLGQPLMFEGEMIGFVDSFSPISSAGELAAVITLKTSVPVGTSLIGSVILENTVLVTVPYGYVHFTNRNAQLHFTDGKVSDFLIVYDDGKNYYGQVTDPSTAALVAAKIVSF